MVMVILIQYIKRQHVFLDSRRSDSKNLVKQSEFNQNTFEEGPFMSAVYRCFWSIDINNLTRTVAKYDKQRELKKQDMTLLNTKVKLWENKARKLKMNNETMEGELGRGNIRCTPIIRCIFLSRSHNVKMTKEK